MGQWLTLREPVVETSFLGSFRRTVAQTETGVEVRLQHPATERVVPGDQLQIAVVSTSVLARPTA